VEKRIQVLDIARGLAIIGTLGTNIWIFSKLGNYDFMLGFGMNDYSLDTILESLVLFLTNGKFLGLLTILFGMGLELKRQSFVKRNQEHIWLWLYIWSMLLLLADGFLHFLFVFEYDILMSYAVTGIIVALLVRRKIKLIKILALILGILHIAGVLLISFILEAGMRFPGSQEEFSLALNEIAAVYSTGSYLDQVLFRFDGIFQMRLEAIAVIPMNILLFLFGVYLVRAGIFRQTKRSEELRKKFFFWGLVVGIPLNALVFLPFYSMVTLVRYLFAPLMAVGYLMAIHWILERKANHFLLQRLSEVGRTALSCYILQNITASVLFYSWGFSLGGKLNSVGTIVVFIFITLLMMIFAHFWLRKYNRGPFEMIWRRLTNAPFARFMKETA